MKNGKPLIAIVNSSSFGISFPGHLAALSAFAELIRVEIPRGAPAAVFHFSASPVSGFGSRTNHFPSMAFSGP